MHNAHTVFVRGIGQDHPGVSKCKLTASSSANKCTPFHGSYAMSWLRISVSMMPKLHKKGSVLCMMGIAAPFQMPSVIF